MPHHEHNDFLEGYLVLCYPPIAVWVHQGECTYHILINFILSILTFHIGGICHACWFCFMREDDCVRCREPNVVIVDQRHVQPSVNPSASNEMPRRPSQENSDVGVYEEPPNYDAAPCSKRALE
ncbi:hypothetical protein L596_029039 [Steinernema carpocapsae]|uniref:Uncharacterized protein n=1 Tax=Steinernema carpocapsae TaxID=34508 RepID=A0A4V5ZXD9_STECR|nr:hypothetical protein L596_029039 [Steinernema carpocapsae]